MTGNAPAGGEIPILDQPLDKDSLYQLRASVAAHALQAGLPQRRADDLVIAAHELAANVVRHGSGRGRLRLWTHGQTLHCQVTDDGRQETSSGWRIEPGHGLWLVRKLADNANLHTGRTGSAVTISFTLGSAGALEPFRLACYDGGGRTVVSVAGQLDVKSAGELTDTVDRLLARDPAARLVIDLAGLTFWDVFGLAGLLRAQGRIESSAGASLTLSGLPAQLDAHLRETGLVQQFNVASVTRPPGGGDPLAPAASPGQSASPDDLCPS